MGGGSFSYSDYSQTARSLNNKSVNEVLHSKTINESFNPQKVKIRESRNSVDNPVTTPIIIGLDVTGSMGHIAVDLLKAGVGRTIQSINSSPNIHGPQILFAAVGDSKCDSYPLQVTQFESDNRMVDQLQMIWNHKGGGGNGGESYFLPWVFADKKVQADAINEGRKGYIFTVGDEPVHKFFSEVEQVHVFGSSLYEKDVTADEIYESVSKNWFVFHLCVGDRYEWQDKTVTESFKFMDDHFVILKDSSMLPEIIGAIIHLNEGTRTLEELMVEADPKTRALYESAFG